MLISILAANNFTLPPDSFNPDDKKIDTPLVPAIPFMGSVKHFGRHICSGVLLSQSNVFTSCHCLGNFVISGEATKDLEFLQAADPLQHFIEVGQLDYRSHSPNRQSRQAKEFHPYPRCRKKNGFFEWDLGFIVTVEPFDPSPHVGWINFSNPKTINSRIVELFNQDKCRVMGWSTTAKNVIGLVDGNLRTAKIEIVPYQECVKILSEKHNRSKAHDLSGRAQVCARGVNVSDASCIADFEGPLMCENDVFGIYSYAYNCGANAALMVFASSPDFVDWYTDKGRSRFARSSLSTHGINIVLLKCVLTINWLI
ncbi:Tryp_SPc [Nesidiocoris tenuis]|uniref:Tryp_SPc n=1 Tax=Nesidiocoris tenuis TaxID=355587 RepID=A0ABN7BDW2_9HEMI|nr:Tryp_SPc [Nesidiocoris tenuis]